MLNFFILAGLFSISLAQCTGNFSNATHQVSVNWTVIGNNSVRFTYTAPANSSQFVALGFTTSAFQLFPVILYDILISFIVMIRAIWMWCLQKTMELLLFKTGGNMTINNYLRIQIFMYYILLGGMCY